MTRSDRASRPTRRPPRRTTAPSTGAQEPQTAEQTAASRASAGSPAQWLIGLFIVLAVIASLIMVLRDDISMAASLAVIAALWAAVIGAVLVTKYRRQADIAEHRARDLRLVYELQLEREIAARRQYESEVETAIRHELAEETNEEFEALKAQVLALRASLEQLLGNPLPDVPLALRPERRRELDSGLSRASYVPAADDRVAADLDFETTAPPADPGRHVPTPEAALEAESAAGDVEMTEIIPVITDETEDGAEVSGGEEYAHGQYVDAEYAEVEVTEADYSESAGYRDSPYGTAQYEAPQYGSPQYGSPQYESPQPPVAASAADYAPPSSGYGSSGYGSSGYGSSGAGEFGATGYPAASGYADGSDEQSAVPPVPEVPPMPQRGRRAAADDGAHSAGQPASELLDRLRRSAGQSSGRRRRD